jgi:hypothetical protein
VEARTGLSPILPVASLCSMMIGKLKLTVLRAAQSTVSVSQYLPISTARGSSRQAGSITAGKASRFGIGEGLPPARKLVSHAFCNGPCWWQGGYRLLRAGSAPYAPGTVSGCKIRNRVEKVFILPREQVLPVLVAPVPLLARHQSAPLTKP